MPSSSLFLGQRLPWAAMDSSHERFPIFTHGFKRRSGVLGVGIQVSFTLFSSINIAVNATGFLYLLTFIFTMISFFLSRRRIKVKDQKEQFLVPFYPVVPLLALLISVGLLIPVGRTGFLTGMLWLLIGGVLYAIRSKTIHSVDQNRLRREQRTIHREGSLQR